MFTKSSKFYDAIYHFIDYKSGSEKLHKIISKYKPGAKTLLDIACGTARHIEYLNKYYYCEGLDINSELLKIARKRCPGNFFHYADMTKFKLRKKFDVVACLFSSIAYVKTEKKLFSAAARMSEHTKQNGLVIIEPWFNKKNFWVDYITANYFDEKDLKITRMNTSTIRNGISVLDFHYMVGTPKKVTYFSERHEIGLFDKKQYTRAMEAAGLKVYYDDKGLFGRGMYIGIKI